MPTHADVATRLVAKLPPGVFAHAARAAVIHQDFVPLKRMLPAVEFGTYKVSVDEWQLFGICEDGSIAQWIVGG